MRLTEAELLEHGYRVVHCVSPEACLAHEGVHAEWSIGPQAAEKHHGTFGLG